MRQFLTFESKDDKVAFQEALPGGVPCRPSEF